ncbi:MAG: hypothetical protein KKD44_03110 [Proteobacteria bacterium]|nr:hypothetical protein [Pseudomonadota bacterium]
MKLKTALIATVAFMFLSGVMAGADQLSDLKTQVESLEQKVEGLESKQKEQDLTLEKVPEIVESVEGLRSQPSAREVVSQAMGNQATIGGHFKFYLADQARGDVNDQSQHNSFSMGISELWLYVNKSVTDWLQITVAPEIAVMAEATPSLGGEITRSNSSSMDVDLDEAFMTVRLPGMFELKVGAFYPLFCEEYATKSWWHEQYHNNNGLVTLQAMQSTGLELYRNFDFENFSLPMSFSLVNGESRGLDQDSRFTDNNSAKTAMLHLAPEFFVAEGRLRMLGSAGYGRWDNEGDYDAYQWAAGFEYTRSSLSLSSEYLLRWREALPLTGGGTEDGEDKGWYAKVKYSYNTKVRFVLKYSDVDLWATSTSALLTDNYKTVSLAGGWWVTDSSTIIPQIEYVDAERSNSQITLKYTRYTLGWRTTF